VFLPATNVTIPSDDWLVINVNEYPRKESDTFSRFSADILHIPSGFHLVASSTSNINKFSWKVIHPENGEETPAATMKRVIDAWNDLALKSLPVLQAESRRYGFSDNIWSSKGDERLNLKDGLLELFVTEFLVAKTYTESAFTIVRNDAEDTYHPYAKIPKPELMALDFEGSFWDGEMQDWVKLDFVPPKV
jgi:hypothetical protein